MPSQTCVRKCTVYRGRGQPVELSMELMPADPPTPSHVPIADRVSLREIMPRELICAWPDLDIAEVVGLMVRNGIGCIPVVAERRRPIGVITKYDIVEQLDALMRAASRGAPLPADLAARTAEDVMMPLALTLDEHVPVSHAAAMMKSEGIHHVLVVGSEGRLVGVVSSRDIVAWVAEQDRRAARRDASCEPPAWRRQEG